MDPTMDELVEQWHYQRRCIHRQYIRILATANRLMRLAEEEQENAREVRP